MEYKLMNYRLLIVWDKSMMLAEWIYRLAYELPRYEEFGLSNQMRRAAVSVPSNIAEGCGRLTPKDFRHFLSIARGSVNELETQIMLCMRFGYMSETRADEFLNLADEIRRMLTALMDRYDD